MARVIMIQGTMSNAGKSLIVAGLCRIFKQDGYRVAPFKSQNMALNSYITQDGLEMGRAQVVQAEAAGVMPDVAMNPILLKPTTDMGSQVIVHGKPIGDMSAMEYYGRKKEFIPAIMEAYNKLDQDFDIIVIEGAGSPAEINLKADDIVNMGMAKLADALVLLVGDIDRGGVFAQLLGTLMLLEEEEKDRVKGLIINKFRGDKEILAPGLAMLEERCHKAVLGVVPYERLHIEEEDSLAKQLDNMDSVAGIDIAVIRFPKLSNFTDLQAFVLEENVSVRYVNNVAELGEPDVVILPGSKSTSADMLWMRENGLEAAIKKLAHKGMIVIGICGGYQMLGVSVEEYSDRESIKGMGLIPIKTKFQQEKTRTQINGRLSDVEGALKALSGKEIYGYEIHMGESDMTDDLEGVFNCYGSQLYLNGRSVGFCRENIFGTYIHGIFDSEEFRSAFVKFLCDKKGMEYGNSKMSYMEFKEQQYDKLAQMLRDSLDMNEIYNIMGLER
ncbi:MAG: cobyric acid synthase [Lachnospiraceae bacterium]|nr:cobyric acid synthase [Lachnospiraceae bacterium]